MAATPDKYVRKLVSIPRDLWEQINDYRFKHRFKTESEAMRTLLAKGLEAAESVPAAKPKPKTPKKIS